MKHLNYEKIKDSIKYNFKEYIEDDGYTPSQAVSKIFEEDWRNLNLNIFTKTAYYINLAIECIDVKEIPDFIYEELKYYLKFNKFDNLDIPNDINRLKEDIEKCQKMYQEDYKIVETNYTTKSRIKYLLSLKN